MNDDDLHELARTLPPLRRARLAHTLLKGLQDFNDPDIAEWALAVSDAWVEARRASVLAACPPAVASACETIARHTLSDGGLLDRLRPFVGVDLAHLEELLGAMNALHAAARSTRVVPADAVEGALGLLRYVQLWALDEDGMLRRNHLINAAERESLREWSWQFGESLRHTLHENSQRTKRGSV